MLYKLFGAQGSPHKIKIKINTNRIIGTPRPLPHRAIGPHPRLWLLRAFSLLGVGHTRADHEGDGILTSLGIGA